MSSLFGKIRNTELIVKRDIGIVIAFIICFLCIRCGNDGYMLFALVLLWLVVACIQDISIFKHVFLNKKYIPLYIFLLLILTICSFLGGITTGIGNTLRYITLFCGAMIFDYYKNKPASLKLLTFFSICIWVYYMIKALIFYVQNPGAARLIISHQGSQFGNIALGGVYGLCFGSALLLVLFVSLLFYQKNNVKTKVLLIIGSIICFCVCLYTESSITLFSAICATIISLLFVNSHSLKSRLWSLLIVIVLLAFFMVFKEFIGSLLIDWNPTGSRDIDIRIHEIGNVLVNSDYSGVALSGRIETYLISINTIFSKPIFGSVFYNGYPTSIGVSGHSELLDTYALYGMLTGIALTIWYMNNINLHYKWMRIRGNIGCQVLSWLLILLNPFTYNSGSWALFFMVPSLCLLNYNHDNKCELSIYEQGRKKVNKALYRKKEQPLNHPSVVNKRYEDVVLQDPEAKNL